MEPVAVSELKVKAIVIFKFMDEFNELEKIIKSYFQKELNKLALNDSHRLYFYYGGIASKNIFINYSDDKLSFNEHKFELNCFTHLTLNQIMKLAKSDCLSSIFEIDIESLQRKVTYKLPSAMIKVIHMRNKLAHELSELKLTDKDDCIELLSKDKLNELGSDIIYDFELKDDDDQIKLIFSNIIYMRKIKEQLTKA